MIVGGRAVSPVAGYDGFGRQEGWVTSAGERFTLSPVTHLGTRDHHWGTRDGVGGPGRYMGMQHPHSGEWVEFEDFGIWGDHVLYNIGDARKRSATLARRVHRMRFEPDTHLLHSGEVDLVFADGAVKTMTFERLGNQIAFLRCGMYGGPNGGTPDGDLWHGMPVAQGDEVVVHGETFDVNDPAVRSRLAGQDQHHCRVTCDGESHLRPGRALRHAVLRRGQGGGHGLLAPRPGDLNDLPGATRPSDLAAAPLPHRRGGTGHRAGCQRLCAAAPDHHVTRGAGAGAAGPSPSDRAGWGYDGRLHPLEQDRAHRVVGATRVAGDALMAVVDGEGTHQGEDLVPRQLGLPHARARSPARSGPGTRPGPGTRAPGGRRATSSWTRARSASRGPSRAAPGTPGPSRARR